MKGLTADDFRNCIARAHLNGDGQGVREIWQGIARGELSDEQTVAWAKTLASWIVDDHYDKRSSPNRLDRFHTGLVVTGYAEPKLDTLSDEHLLLLSAKAGLRSAAEKVWCLIAKGQATQGTREQWLDHVAKGVWDFINLERLPRDSNRRGDKLLPLLGLAGKPKGNPENALVEALYEVIRLFPKEMYEKKPGGYVRDILDRLADIGAISAARRNDENLARTVREMMKKRPPKGGG